MKVKTFSKKEVIYIRKVRLYCTNIQEQQKKRMKKQQNLAQKRILTSKIMENKEKNLAT